MSSNLGVGKILELLERLKGTVRDFTARAEKLNAEYHARTGREHRLREAAEEKQATELAAAIGEAEAAFAAAREAAVRGDEDSFRRLAAQYWAGLETVLERRRVLFDLDETQRAKLLDMARQAEELRGLRGDAKLAKATDIVEALLREGHRPIVFCRFIPTADYVADGLRDALAKRKGLKDIEIEAKTAGTIANTQGWKMEGMRIQTADGSTITVK